MEEKVIYFAYGSNMSKSRLEERIGSCRSLGVFALKGYGLSFNAGGKTQSWANLIDDDNQQVIGVVYEINRRQLDILDCYEGCNNPKYYVRMVDIYDEENKIPLHFYISFINRENFEKPVTETYMNFLIKGAEENNLIEYANYFREILKNHSL